MGKPSGSGKKKNKKGGGAVVVGSAGAGGGGKSKAPKAGLDKDMEVFISMSHELKEEGNKLFQKRDHEGAMLKYEKALSLLLPGTSSSSSSSSNSSSSNNNDVDVAYLRTNMAACYMQMGLGEYPRAINQCDLALQASPRYTKALLKRSKCYQALSKLDFALRDVNLVLKSEPTNLVALELAQCLRQAVIDQDEDDQDDEDQPPDYPTASSSSSLPTKLVKTKTKTKSKTKTKTSKRKKKTITATTASKKAEKKQDDHVTEELPAAPPILVPTRAVKLVFGEDIRWAHLPVNNCTIQQLRDTVGDRFQCSKPLLVKYKDQEGDLVTITSDEELRWAEASADPLASLRLYLVQVNPPSTASAAAQDTASEGLTITGEDKESELLTTNNNNNHLPSNVFGNGNGAETRSDSSYLDDWIVQFAQVFKSHVGFSSNEYLDLHDLTMKLHSHAMEDMITTEEAQNAFEVAAHNFQEMAALALFNWGNVHMSRARKKVSFAEDATKESILVQVKAAYEWAKNEYIKAGIRYDDALKIKADFYEAHLAIGLQQFEQAKLSWCYAIGCGVDLDTWSSTEVLELFNNAEDNIEKGTLMWQDMDKCGLNQLPKHCILGETEAEQSKNITSQISSLWGIILYERSVVEFKLGLPVWKECLEVAIEKFELAGVSPTDVAVIIKNHCANQTSNEGMGFKVDEIVQAWNEMHNAKRWRTGVPSFRLEPLFRRQIPKLHYDLEHA